jgi:hypothetical protein
MFRFMSRLYGLGLAAIMLGGSGCGWNYSPSENVLPNPIGEGTTESEGPPLDTDETAETGEPAPDVPASYRIDCMDIQSLGDADETVFQVATLQNTWANDIANFKLNILIDLLTLDEAAGTGVITIRSGVGSGWSDQCAEGETLSAEFPVVYEPTVNEWAPSDAEATCAAMGASEGSGTYTLDLGADERIFIYAEDDDGTAFNCSLDGETPDAIPISAISAVITGTPDRDGLAGTLTGCMAQADAENTCSCLSVCSGNVHPDCAGCPGGALPLGVLLGGIMTTSHCSDLLGEPAFDVVLEFSARRLGDVPAVCG